MEGCCPWSTHSTLRSILNYVLYPLTVARSNPLAHGLHWHADGSQAPGGIEALYAELSLGDAGEGQQGSGSSSGGSSSSSAAAIAFLASCVKDCGAVGPTIQLLEKVCAFVCACTRVYGCVCMCVCVCMCECAGVQIQAHACAPVLHFETLCAYQATPYLPLSLARAL